MQSHDSAEENIGSKITAVIQKPKRKVLDPDPDNVTNKKQKTIHCSKSSTPPLPTKTGKRKVSDADYDNASNKKNKSVNEGEHNNQTCDDGKTTNDPDESLDEENIVSKITSVIPKPKRKVLDPDPDNVKPTKKKRKLTKKHNNQTCDDGKTTNDTDEILDECSYINTAKKKSGKKRRYWMMIWMLIYWMQQC